MGIAVLLYDRRGAGQSSGKNDVSYETLADDGIAGARAIARISAIDPRRIGYWGLSQGGWLAVFAAERDPNAAFAVSVSAPLVTPEQQMEFAMANRLSVNGYSQADVDAMLAARKAWTAYLRGAAPRADAVAALSKIDAKPWFDLMYMPSANDLTSNPATSSWRKQMDDDPLAALRRVRVPVLFIYGGNDPWIPVAATIGRLEPLARANGEDRIRGRRGRRSRHGIPRPRDDGRQPRRAGARRAAIAGLLHAARVVAGAPRSAGPRPIVRRPCAVLFDRDETIVVDVPFNGDPERVAPVPNARRLLDRLRAAGLPLAVVSNQSGIGRGLIAAEAVEAVNRRVEELLGPFAGFFVCPHAPEDACECRKPKPKLILDAARALGVEPGCCVVVGDRESDVQAARNAGAIPLEGRRADGLAQAVETILTAPLGMTAGGELLVVRCASSQ